MPDLISKFDGKPIGAHLAPAQGTRRGGVVVIQEIFGVSDHIRDVCAKYAALGYDALAPSLYDRVEPNFQAPHTDFTKGVAAMRATPWDQVQGDVQAAIDALAGPVFITGFCYGGAVSWFAAARCTGLKAASSFYGRLINELLGDKPKIPIQLHYGRKDASIPLDLVDAVRAAHPAADIHLYDGGHGFCREGSRDFHRESCELAFTRTLAWFEGHSA
jgi:carboxymethylenebutenolidase